MSKVIDTIDILIKDIYSYEHWGELDYGYTKTDIRNDVERVRRHLEEKYVIKYGTGVFAGIEQLVMSKWIDCPQPGSMAVNTKYFYDKYIKVAKEYIEYIETECEGIIRENIEKVENYVNSNVYTRLVNEIQVVYDKAGIMEKILPIRRFTYEPQTLFQLVIIDVADIELEWKNRSVRWYIDNVERFIADVKASLNNLLFQMKDMLNKILIEEVQCHINEYLRLETQHVRKRLLEKKNNSLEVLS